MYRRVEYICSWYGKFEFSKRLVLRSQEEMGKMKSPKRGINHGPLRFQADLPFDFIVSKGKSSKARDLYLYYQELASFSAGKGDFPNLERLYLYNNQLTSFSAEEGTFSKLERLDLFRNQLVLFAAGERAFPNLKDLTLWGNRLVSFSAKRGAFSKLRYLNLSGQQLTLFSVEEGTFPNLKVLDLSSNQFTSFIVEEQAFPKLKELYLLYNPNLEDLEVSAPELKELWIKKTKIQFVNETLIGKVKDRKNVQVYEHARGTKRLVIESQHPGHPVVEEIVAHLTR